MLSFLSAWLFHHQVISEIIALHLPQQKLVQCKGAELPSILQVSSLYPKLSLTKCFQDVVIKTSASTRAFRGKGSAKQDSPVAKALARALPNWVLFPAPTQSSCPSSCASHSTFIFSPTLYLSLLFRL